MINKDRKSVVSRPKICNLNCTKSLYINKEVYCTYKEKKPIKVECGIKCPKGRKEYVLRRMRLND